MDTTEVRPIYIKTVQWMELTNMSRSDVYKYIYAGELKAVKIGKRWLIHASELEDFFERMNEAA